MPAVDLEVSKVALSEVMHRDDEKSDQGDSRNCEPIWLFSLKWGVGLG